MNSLKLQLFYELYHRELNIFQTDKSESDMLLIEGLERLFHVNLDINGHREDNLVG